MTPSNKNYFRSIVFTKYTLVVLCVAIIVSVLPKGRTFKYEFDKGKPWMHQNLNAPFDFAIEKSKEEIDLEKNKINKIGIVYNLDVSSGPGSHWTAVFIDNKNNEINSFV